MVFTDFARQLENVDEFLNPGFMEQAFGFCS